MSEIKKNLSKPSINYNIGDWVIEISTKKLYEIVSHNYTQTMIISKEETVMSHYDYGLKIISGENKDLIIGVDKDELDRDSILVKNKIAAKAIYG